MWLQDQINKQKNRSSEQWPQQNNQQSISSSLSCKKLVIKAKIFHKSQTSTFTNRLEANVTKKKFSYFAFHDEIKNNFQATLVHQIPYFRTSSNDTQQKWNFEMKRVNKLHLTRKKKSGRRLIIRKHSSFWRRSNWNAHKNPTTITEQQYNLTITTTTTRKWQSRARFHKRQQQ